MGNRELVDKEHEEQTDAARQAAPKDEHEASAHALLELQRRAGNRAASAFVQPKLEVGAADDAYEREADEIATSVVGHGGTASSGHGGGEAFSAPSHLAEFVGRTGGGAPLAASVRRKLEPTFGLGFDDVRVHTDNKTAAMAESIGARAFTYGNDVYFGRGAYRPGSRDGDHLLAHELTHVVQQTGTAQRKIARSLDGKKVPTRLAQRRIQGNFLKKAKDKAQQFLGKSKKDVREKTQEPKLEEKSKPELQDYMARTKGGGPAENPDWSNPKFFGQQPTRYVVKLAVAQEDANWLKNMKALRNEGYKAIFSKKGREALGNMDKKYLAEKALESQGTLEGLTDFEIKQQIEKFTEGMYDVGHTWIRLETYVGPELKDLYSYGMWPAKIKSLEVDENYGGFAGPVSLGQGEIRHPDNMHEGDKMIAYYGHDTKKKEFEKALAVAGERYKAPPPYVLVGYNCTAFAREVFQAGGGTYPSKGRLLPGFAYTPGNLYAAIQKKVEEDQKRKDKGGLKKGKAKTKDSQEYIVSQVKKKQQMLSEAGTRDVKAEAFANPPDNADETEVDFWFTRTFRYGTRPDYAKDNSVTLDKSTTMTLVDHPEALQRWDVETYRVGPKKYWYIPAEDAKLARKSPVKGKKLPKLPGQKKKDPTVVLIYNGQGGGPPSDMASPKDDLSPDQLGDWIEKKRVGNWVKIYDTVDEKSYWAKAEVWDFFMKPKGETGGEGEKEKPPVVMLTAYQGRGLASPPAPGDKPIAEFSSELLPRLKLEDTDNGWVLLYNVMEGSQFWVREDAYKHALDPKKNPPPLPVREPEPLKDEAEDLDTLDSIIDDMSDGGGDTLTATKDELPVYDSMTSDAPSKTVETNLLEMMMVDFEAVNDQWRNIYLPNEGSYYYVREADYEDWLVLTGKKEPQAKGPQVSADQIPTYDNAGDSEPSGVVTTKQVEDFFIDFEPYKPGWLSIQVMGNYLSVKEDDYEKWLALTGRK